MSKAFDEVKHSAILRALQRQGAGDQLTAFVASMLQQSTIKLGLGSASTRTIDLDRGVPQGAPESPSLFISVTDMALAELLDGWRARGFGYNIDGVRLPIVVYADDVLVLAQNEEDLQIMLAEVTAAFGQVGLEINLSKTHYSSSVENGGRSISVVGQHVVWTPEIIFLGSAITLTGNDEAAIRARMQKATQTFREWAPVLTNSRLPVEARAEAYKTSVMASFCWQAQNWTPTVKQYKFMSSWASRQGASMKLLQRHPEEEIGQWWRRLHRDGKRFMDVNNLNVVNKVKEAKYNFAGHVARMDPQDIVNQILHVRPLAWWRYQQSLPSNSTSHRARPHTQRFNALRRWESSLEICWGSCTAPSAQDVVGWMHAAQDRDRWRRGCHSFVNS